MFFIDLLSQRNEESISWFKKKSFYGRNQSSKNVKKKIHSLCFIFSWKIYSMISIRSKSIIDWQTKWMEKFNKIVFFHMQYKCNAQFSIFSFQNFSHAYHFANMFIVHASNLLLSQINKINRMKCSLNKFIGFRSV